MPPHVDTTLNGTGASPSAAERAVSALLRAVGRRLQWGALLRQVTVLLTLAALFPLVFVVADHAWPGGLPRQTRFVALMAWLGGTAVGLLGLITLVLGRRLNPALVAQCVERAFDVRHNSLVNAVLVRKSAAQSHAAVPAARQAARDLQSHDQVRAVRLGGSRLPAALAAAAATLWLLYVLVTPKAVWPSLLRLLGLDVPAPTATRLELLRPGPTDVCYAGEPLEIEVAVRGRIPDNVWFEILRPGGGTVATRHDLDSARGPASGGSRLLRLAPHEVTRDLHYVCRGGDARLAGVIPVQRHPEILDYSLSIRPPDYTREPAYETHDPDVHAWAGTTATLRVRTNVPVRDPVFIFDGRDSVRRRMLVDDATPDAAQLDLTLTESGQYRVEFRDRWGSPQPRPVSHFITVRPDAGPFVEITRPAAGDVPGDVVNVRGGATLEVQATDDLNVAELTLVQRRDGSTTRQTVEPDADSGAELAGPVRATVTLDERTVPPGSKTEVWFEARDQRPMQAAATGRSRSLTIINEAHDERPLAEANPSDPSDSQPPGGESVSSSQPEELEGESASPDDADDQASDANEDGGAAAPGEPTGKGSEPGAATGASGPSPSGGDQAGDGAGSDPGPGDGAAGDAGDRQGGDQPRDAAAADSGAPQPGGQMPDSGGATDSDGSLEADLRREIERFAEDHREEIAAANDVSSGRAETGGPASTEGEADSANGQPQNAEESSSASDARQGASGTAGEQSAGESAARSPRTSGQAGRTPREESADSSQPGFPAIPESSGAPTGVPPTGEDPAASDRTSAPPPVNNAGPDSPGAGKPEILDLLALLERDPPTSEELVERLGWPQAKADAFIHALTRLRFEVRRLATSSELHELFHDARIGDDRVQSGTGFATSARQRVPLVPGQSDDWGSVVPAAEQDIPPELRPLLEAYYRALAASPPR